jgi:hypothetical protein
MNFMNVTNILKKFEPVALDDLGDKLYTNRYETKYLLSPGLLPVIIEKLTGSYRVLCIKDHYIQDYESLYFDNQEFKFYLDHHNGKLNRYKVRFRKYHDAKKIYFEIKFKNNKNQTIKRREQIARAQFGERVLTDQNSLFIDTFFGNNPGRLLPRFCVSYSRIALIHKDNNERVTIDLNLSYKKEGVVKQFDDICIAEVKLGTQAQHSDFSDMMRKLHITPIRFSKYCYGIYLFYPDLKHNRFKPRYLFFDRNFNGRS